MTEFIFALLVGGLVTQMVMGLVNRARANAKEYSFKIQIEDLQEEKARLERRIAQLGLDSKIWRIRYEGLVNSKTKLDTPDNTQFGTYHGGGPEL
jgi:hypothetical protein